MMKKMSEFSSSMISKNLCTNDKCETCIPQKSKVNEMKLILETNNEMYEEMKKFVYEKESNKQLKKLKQTLAYEESAEETQEEKEKRVADHKFIKMLRDLQCENSNFSHYGCRHNFSFFVGDLQVEYKFSMRTPNRGWSPENLAIYIENEPIIFLDYESGFSLMDIDIDCEFGGEELCPESVEVFKKIAKKYFPDDNPEFLFYFILRILSKYHDTCFFDSQ